MLVVSSVSEAAGIHAFLGAFLVGIALADARATQDEAHEALGRFVLSFAPINFVAMGMAANFIEHFDPLLVAIVLVVACLSKVDRLHGTRDLADGGPGDAMAARRETLVIASVSVLPRRHRHRDR